MHLKSSNKPTEMMNNISTILTMSNEVRNWFGARDGPTLQVKGNAWPVDEHDSYTLAYPANDNEWHTRKRNGKRLSEL